MLNPPTRLPAVCSLRDEVLANFNDDAPIAQWFRGFLRGHQWLEKLWEEGVPKALLEELNATLMTLTAFSSRQLAEDFVAEATTSEPSLENAADTIHGIFPRAVNQYAHIGRSIATVTVEHDAEAPEPTRATKVGRTAPCPCGSGKKYKQCCGATVH